VLIAQRDMSSLAWITGDFNHMKSFGVAVVCTALVRFVFDFSS
jgi:hypothetical protein